MYDDRNFMIFSVSELDQIDFSLVLETSSETVRKNIDGTKTFVKWDGETPECIKNLSSKEGPYSYMEMIELLNGPEWTSTDPMP